MQVSRDIDWRVIDVCMPKNKKKPKGKELTLEEKQENKRISGIRIKVEHAIGGMKKCRIVKERFRCHKFGFEDMVILIACGLHNFRISHKMSRIVVYLYNV
ncbi:transposase family protein [Bacteroides ovatus]|uniref:transposase family protein n=1 Tax=Bacteroides ovatus TaxID=28116 RepID=UPI003D64B506